MNRSAELAGIRSILLQIDDTPGGAARLACAADLARIHGAALAVMAVTSPPTSARLSLALSEGPAAVFEQQADTEVLDRIRAMFDRSAAGLVPVARWLEGGADPVGAFRRQALCSDLLVLGPRDPTIPASFQASPDFIETTVIATGRPALMLPAARTRSVGRDVLIGWDASACAARAISVALPWLALAKTVQVLESSDARPPAGARALDLFGYLRLHGVEAVPADGAAPSGKAGETLLAKASEVGADLLVMGCYGHSRVRERVFGGATRSVLDALPLAVLMAH